MSFAIRQLRRMQDEAGFTLVELMMAAMVAAIGVGALTTVLIGSRQLTNDAERGGAAAQVAQRELERTLAIPYANLAMGQAPSTSSDPLDPRFHVAGGGSGWTFKWNGTTAAPVLIDTAAGQVDAASGWADGRLTGTIHRFVTSYDDPSVVNNASNPLPDAKRVTVAVTANGGEQRRKPVQLTSVVFP